MIEFQDSFVLLINGEISEVITKFVQNTRRSLWIATANLKDAFFRKNRRFVPLVRELSILSMRGVDVRIIYAAEPSSNFRKEVENLEHNIKFFNCRRNHMKFVIRDDEEIMLASANLTGAGLGARSEYKRNFEFGLLSKNKILIENMSEMFYNIMSKSFCSKCTAKKYCEEFK